jgi:hypothetical protein
MSREEGEPTAFQRELEKTEIISGFRKALDFRYRAFCKAARADWERLFQDKDPADACVTVRVAAVESRAIRGSGFLKSRTPVGSKSSAKSLPHFAH